MKTIPSVKLLKLYAPKEHWELFLYHKEYQQDQIPRSGIWETIGVSNLDDGAPLYTLRLVSQWGETKHAIGDTVKIRLDIMEVCFDRVELSRTAIPKTCNQEAAK